MSPALRLTPSARRGSRCVAALAAVFQLVAWVHAGGAPHVTCAEHGEAVHLAAPAATPAVAVATTASPDGAATADAHDHCRLQHQGRAQALDADRTFIPVDGVAPPALAARAVPARATVLSFAPKTSPPA